MQLKPSLISHFYFSQYSLTFHTQRKVQKSQIMRCNCSFVCNIEREFFSQLKIEFTSRMETSQREFNNVHNLKFEELVKKF